MNIEDFYRDYGIDFKSHGEHKHVREGYLNIKCPFCTGNPGFHLSYNIFDEYFICWRCGWKPEEKVISSLLNCSWNEAKSVIKKYDGRVIKTKEANVKIMPFKLPSNVTELQKNHINYLLKRNFDPQKVVKDFYIQGTGVYSTLKTYTKTINYKFRLIIPYFWDNKMVSFDSRDITEKSMNKYQACPEIREDVPRKSIIYGRPDLWKDKLICVEGPTDVWRFGAENAGAVSGIKYTSAQVSVLSKFKRVPVCFDGGELQASLQASHLVGELKFRGVDSFKVDINGDPGNLTEEEAQYLVKQLLSKTYSK